jgi:hypothetical protein
MPTLRHALITATSLDQHQVASLLTMSHLAIQLVYILLIKPPL